MIEVAQKYALDVRSPAPITSERQHGADLSVLDKLASKERTTAGEEEYAQVLMTLIEAYEPIEPGGWEIKGRPLCSAHVLRGKPSH